MVNALFLPGFLQNLLNIHHIQLQCKYLSAVEIFSSAARLLLPQLEFCL
jgi:hypothetical protein